MREVCECMIIEHDDGSSMCRLCHGDIYGCECPMFHRKGCDRFELAAWEKGMTEYGEQRTEELEFEQDRWSEASES